MARKKSEIIVFAGPNGSGKSTLAELLRPRAMTWIDADEIQRALRCENLEAARIAEDQREELLAAGDSFSFETVLSTDRNLDLLERAKAAGYTIHCYYVVTADPLINAGRVMSRVAAGGHGVPSKTVFALYDNALKLLPRLLPICSVCNIFDNSTDSPYRIFKKEGDQAWYCPRPHIWTKEQILSLTGMEDAEKDALNLLHLFR